MNVLDNLIDDLVFEIIGKEVIPIVNILRKKESVSEFKLASKLGLTVNQVRNILYKLNNHNLVDFIKKKDKGEGGYGYIYYWYFNLRLAKELLVNFKKNKINILKKRLEKESNEIYFICPSDCVRFDSTNAMEYSFKCPECGKILVKEDNRKNIEKIKKEINKIEDDLKQLQELEEKKKKAEIKKLEKEKELERLKKLRKKTREEKKKKANKKQVKKKLKKSRK